MDAVDRGSQYIERACNHGNASATYRFNGVFFVTFFHVRHSIVHLTLDLVLEFLDLELHLAVCEFLEGFDLLVL